MINEVEEFSCYTTPVVYEAVGKKDVAWMRRMTTDMIETGEGFQRILTIVARGYLWTDGAVDLERARRALCAWCSIPDTEKAGPKAGWENRTGYAELHDEFPELVDEDGWGWLIRHVHGICMFARENPKLVQKTRLERCMDLEKTFDKRWRECVLHYQVPLFTPTKTASWGLSFDGVLADAQEQGPLRDPQIRLSGQQEAWIRLRSPDKIPPEVLRTLIIYYLVNRQEDSDWVVLPVTNFAAYFGTTTFSRKWLPALCKTGIVRDTSGFGVSRYRPADDFPDISEFTASR